MRLRSAWIACLLGTGLMGFAHGQDSAQLRFAWPDRLVADVQFQKTKSKQTNDQKPVADGMASRYVMRAQRRGDQHVVSFSDLRMDEARLSAMPAEARALLDILAKAAQPSFVVSGGGEFVELENLPAFQAAMRSFLDKALPEGPVRERAKPMLDNLLTDATLQALAQVDWNWQVAAWAGADRAFDLGDDYVSTTQAQMPVVNEILTQRTRFKLARKLPCEREGQVRECVELLASTRPDDTELSKAVNAFLDKLAPAGAKRDKKDTMSLDSETTVELVTETATLIPHRFKRSKNISVSTVEAGKATTLRQVEMTEQTFRYRQPD